MSREKYLMQQRNKLIREQFWKYIRNGMPRMQAYAMTASHFFLAENTVRNIVNLRKDNGLRTKD